MIKFQLKLYESLISLSDIKNIKVLNLSNPVSEKTTVCVYNTSRYHRQKETETSEVTIEKYILTSGQ